jgi:hypothetical protein
VFQNGTGPEQQQRARRRRVKKFETDGGKGVHALNITVFRFGDQKGEQQLGEFDAAAAGKYKKKVAVKITGSEYMGLPMRASTA